MGIDTVHFAGLDERGDDGPVFGSGIMAREEGVLAVQGDGADGSFDGFVVASTRPSVRKRPRPSRYPTASMKRIRCRGWLIFCGETLEYPRMGQGSWWTQKAECAHVLHPLAEGA